MAKIVTEFMHLKDRRMTAFRHLLSYPTKIVPTHNGQRGVFYAEFYTYFDKIYTIYHKFALQW